jgi:hypothetical protein
LSESAFFREPTQKYPKDAHRYYSALIKMVKHEFLATIVHLIGLISKKLLFFHDLFRTNLLVKKDVKKVLIDLGFVASM